MFTININGKDHVLKVNYEGVKYINRIVKDGAQADIDLYSHVIYAGLDHTGEPYTVADVRRAIELLDISDVKRMSDELVTASRYYNSVVTMMLHENKRRIWLLFNPRSF